MLPTNTSHVMNCIVIIIFIIIIIMVIVITIIIIIIIVIIIIIIIIFTSETGITIYNYKSVRTTNYYITDIDH